jgi:hypothetical protein
MAAAVDKGAEDAADGEDGVEAGVERERVRGEPPSSAVVDRRKTALPFFFFLPFFLNIALWRPPSSCGAGWLGLC